MKYIVQKKGNKEVTEEKRGFAILCKPPDASQCSMTLCKDQK